jgi:hypothetical protein
MTIIGLFKQCQNCGPLKGDSVHSMLPIVSRWYYILGYWCLFHFYSIELGKSKDYNAIGSSFNNNNILQINIHHKHVFTHDSSQLDVSSTKVVPSNLDMNGLGN